MEIVIPEERNKTKSESSPEKQCPIGDVTSDLSTTTEQPQDADAGDTSDNSDNVDGYNDDIEGEDIPVWMRDPPSPEETQEPAIRLSPSPQKESLGPKEKHECKKCKATFFNPWDFDLHTLRCGVVRKKRTCKSRKRTGPSECIICHEVVKRKDLLFHLFKEHGLPYEDAMKKIPGFNVSLSMNTFRKSKSAPTCKYSACKCDLCDTVISKNDMLMHLYRYHGFSYNDAIERLAGMKTQKKKSAHKQHTCRRGKGKTKSSPKVKDGTEGIKGTVTRKLRSQQQRTELTTSRRSARLQSKRITYVGQEDEEDSDRTDEGQTTIYPDGKDARDGKEISVEDEESNSKFEPNDKMREKASDSFDGLITKEDNVVTLEN